MTRNRTERGRGESVHHGGPTPRFVGGTQSSHGQLVGPISPAVLPPSDVGCRLIETANGMPRRARRGFAAWRIRCMKETGVGVAPQRGDAAGSGVRSTPRGHLDFLQRHTSLGYEIVCPVRCDRRTACSGYPTPALAARFRPRLVEPALSLSIAYLAP